MDSVVRVQNLIEHVDELASRETSMDDLFAGLLDFLLEALGYDVAWINGELETDDALLRTAETPANDSGGIPGFEPYEIAVPLNDGGTIDGSIGLRRATPQAGGEPDSVATIVLSYLSRVYLERLHRLREQDRHVLHQAQRIVRSATDIPRALKTVREALSLSFLGAVVVDETGSIESEIVAAAGATSVTGDRARIHDPASESGSNRRRYAVAVGAADEICLRRRRVFAHLAESLTDALLAPDGAEGGLTESSIEELAARVSRAVIDDLDIDEQAATMREAVGLGFCAILLLDRLTKTFSIEGASWTDGHPAAEHLQVLELGVGVLGELGVSRADLHRLNVITIEDQVDASAALGRFAEPFRAALQALRGYAVFHAPLFDSYRRLQGLVFFIAEPETDVPESALDAIRRLAASLSNAFEIRRNTYFDTTTGLPNVSRIRAIVSERLVSFQEFSLVLCKITNLDEVSLARGDEFVDECMEEMGRRFRGVLQDRSYLVIGRDPGDSSFLVVCPSVDSQALAGLSAELLGCIAEPITIRGTTVNFFASIGACHSTDVSDSGTLFSFCKLAVRAISGRHNAYRLFDTQMQRRYAEEKSLEADLHEAIRRRELLAHYQPKVALDGTIAGFEALVRWVRSDKMVPPDVFLEKVEQMGLMHQLFDIVFERVCRDMEAGEILGDVSVNISPVQLSQSNLHRRIGVVLARYGIDPSRITLEFVESAALHAGDAAIREFKDLGLRVSLDDFGTGYARYKTLIEMFDAGLVDELKIDRAFVNEIESKANRDFVRSITALAREFDAHIVIEGVETWEQAAALESIDPDLVIQGWLISKALPVEDLDTIDQRAVTRLFDMHRRSEEA